MLVKSKINLVMKLEAMQSYVVHTPRHIIVMSVLIDHSLVMKVLFVEIRQFAFQLRPVS